MAEPNLVEFQALRDLLDIFYVQLSSSFDENSRKLIESSHTQLSQAASQISMLREEEAKGRSLLLELQTSIEGLGDVVSVAKSTGRDAELELSRQEEYRASLDLQQRYNTLQQDHQNLITENKEVVQMLNAEQQRARESEVNQRFWKAKFGRLQTVITKNATNANEVIDSEVKAKIEHIRARTEIIVKKYCVGRRAHPKRDHREMELFDKEWSRKEKQIPARLSQSHGDVFLTYLMRSQIYMVLEREIFRRPCFGLEHDLEVKLAEFEKLISKQKPEGDISDWRATTLRYSKLLDMKNEVVPEEVAKYFTYLFDPFVRGNADNLLSSKGNKYKYPAQLHADLEELCREAYDLTVMIRQGTDRYYFISIEEETKVKSSEETDFQTDDMMGPTDKYVGSKVWVTLFGALIKETQSGERHVMEKARVICRAAPPLSGQPNEEYQE